MSLHEHQLGELQTVSIHGRVTHVLVPIEQFEQLTAAAGTPPPPGPSRDEIDQAVAALNSPDTEWVDAEDVFKELLTDGLKRVRQELGMTQQQLADALRVSQAQVSRMEKDLGSTSVASLRRLTEILLKLPRTG